MTHEAWTLVNRAKNRTYKYDIKGQEKDGHQVYDIFGQPIKCDGSWKQCWKSKFCIECIVYCQRDIWTIFWLQWRVSQTGRTDKLSRLQNTSWQSTFMEKGWFKTLTLSDSRQCSRYKNSSQLSAINGADHEVNGSTPLTPMELLLLRRSWLSSNKLEDLQAWVMTLLAVKLLKYHRKSRAFWTKNLIKINLFLNKGLGLEGVE